MKAGTASVAVSIAAAAVHNATVTGSAVDLANYGSNQFVITPGVITDGTHTPKLQHSADGSTNWTDCVPGTDQTGAAFANLASSTSQSAGYLGNDRYVRWVVTVTAGATGGYYTAVGLLGLKRRLP